MAAASSSTVIAVPGLPTAAFGGCHAIKVGRLLWISGVDGTRPDGAPYPGDALAELSQALGHLRATLAAADLGTRDLVRVNVYYAPSRLTDAELAACQSALAAAIEADRCACVSAMLAPIAGAARIAIDAIAADRHAKQVLPAAMADDARPWASATRVGSTIFVGAVAPARAVLASASSRFFDRSYSAHRQLAQAIDRVRERWPDCRGLADVVRVHQHVTQPDIDLAEFRRSREDLLRTGEFVSTTVLAGANDPDRVGVDPWIKIDAELAIGGRRRISVPGVWANPGGLHAVGTDDLTFFQAQMGRGDTGASVHTDNPERHAAQLYANIDGMLAGAALDWGRVVHVRVFCRDQHQIASAARALESRIAGRPCATTCVIAGFFDPRALLEVEVTAAA